MYIARILKQKSLNERATAFRFSNKRRLVIIRPNQAVFLFYMIQFILVIIPESWYLVPMLMFNFLESLK